jgi:hypothetical protein
LEDSKGEEIGCYLLNYLGNIAFTYTVGLIINSNQTTNTESSDIYLIEGFFCLDLTFSFLYVCPRK